MFKKLKKLFKAQNDAHDAIEREVKRLYPIGSIVRVKRRGTIATAEVLGTHTWGCEHSLQVRNTQTLKEYWVPISSYAIPEVETP